MVIDLPAPIDITIGMGEDMPVYPGDERPCVRRLSSIMDGAALTSSEVLLGCHAGTHVDAPAHFIEGAQTVAGLPLRHFYGPAVVMEFAGVDRITVGDVANLQIPTGRHILIKTRNSALLHQSGFDPGYCFVEPEAARHIARCRPLSVGFDYYSLDPPSGESFPSHLEIAGHGLPAFVCLNLLKVLPGEYWFVALPLGVPDVEGLPVRAVLFHG